MVAGAIRVLRIASAGGSAPAARQQDRHRQLFHASTSQKRGLSYIPWRSAALQRFYCSSGADGSVGPLLPHGVILTRANDAVPSRLCSEVFPCAAVGPSCGRSAATGRPPGLGTTLASARGHDL